MAISSNTQERTVKALRSRAAAEEVMDAVDLSTTTLAAGAATVGAGAKNGATVTVAETGNEVIHKSLLTLVNTVVNITDDVGVVAYGSVKLYDFPAGAIQVLGGVIDLTATVSGNGIDDDYNGDYSLGSVAAGNTNTLSSTEVDIFPTTASTVASGGVAKMEASGATLVAASIDGTAVNSEVDMYLNIIVDDGDQDVNSNASDLLCNGTIAVHWINLGDIA